MGDDGQVCDEASGDFEYSFGKVKRRMAWPAVRLCGCTSVDDHVDVHVEDVFIW